MTRVLIFLSHLIAPHETDPHSSIAEAREAFVHWSQHADGLPWRRRAERREANAMAATWRARLITAHLQRLHLGQFETALMPVLDTGGRSAGAHARRLALSSARRTAIGRRVLAAAFAAAAMTVAGLVATALLLAHFGVI
jgi:hypothetical protein